MERIIRDMDLLHPAQRVQFVNLANRLSLAFDRGEIPDNMKVFETWRSPIRQNELLAQGKVTKAPAWSSAHQFGLAVDFAKIDDAGKWSWLVSDETLDFMEEQAPLYGLAIPMKWDPLHVQSPIFAKIWRTLHKLEPVNT